MEASYGPNISILEELPQDRIRIMDVTSLCWAVEY